jgi:FkbM family methyltransferase
MNVLLERLHQYGLWKFLLFSLNELKLIVFHRWLLGSYSQLKEDLMLDRLMGFKKRGFYVDVGAFDPYRYSNTMRFYKRGWRGINIEPDTERWKHFLSARKRDVNLNIGIAATKKSLLYYRIDPPTLSTFQKVQAKAYQRQGFELLETVKVPVVPLEVILQKYAKGKIIDFMSIDVEGMEMDVLKSNNWKQYRPKFLCIETAAENGDEGKTKKIKFAIEAYLSRVGYVLVFDNGLNSFFKNSHAS